MKIYKLLAIVSFAMLGTSAAHAGFCAAGSACDFHLTNTNVVGVSIDVLVHVDNTGGASTLSVSLASSNLTNAPRGIDQFGYGTTVLASSLPSGWSQASCSGAGNPPCNMDGFGDLISEIDNGGSQITSFSFTLQSLVESFDGFAAHVAFRVPPGTTGSCSAFVSDRQNASNPPTGSIGQCITNGNLVPEPGSLALLGLGVVALGWARRRTR